MKNNGFFRLISVIIVLAFTFAMVIPCFATTQQWNNINRNQNLIEYCSALLWGGESDSEEEIISLCDRINNSFDSNSSDEKLSCGTIDLIRLRNFICAHENDSDIYESKKYIENTYDSLARMGTTNARSSEYIMSSDGHFRIYYDSIPIDERDSLLFWFMGEIFEGVRSFFVSSYGFNEPFSGEGYYSVFIKSSLGISWGGMTEKTGDNTSYILMRYDYLQDFWNDSDHSYVLGVAAHEYMHAILYSYGIPYDLTNYGWFHESLARAAGISYEVEYANAEGVCSDIRRFISSLNTPIYQYTGENEGSIRNGSCVFFLFLCDEYDDWDTVREILCQFQYEDDLMSAIICALSYNYSVSFENTFGHFMVYNAEPDLSYSASPYNNAPSGSVYSWGEPPMAVDSTISWYHQSLQCSGNVESQSTAYLHYRSTTTSPRNVSFSLSFSLLPLSTTYCIYAYYRDYSGGFHHLGSYVSSPVQDTLTMSLNGNNELFIIVVNTSQIHSDQMSYSISVDISSR